MKPHAQRRPHRGFSLIEVVIAVAIVSFCLLTLMALLPLGVTSSRDTLQRTTAANIASEIAADLRLPQGVGPAFTIYNPSPRFGIPTAASAAGTTTTLYFGNQDNFATTTAGVAPQPALYRATITFYSVNTATNCTTARILVTWPALADANTPLPTNFTGAVDVSTALNPTSP